MNKMKTTTPRPGGRLLPIVRFWCRIFGHVQAWSPDDADKYCRRCGHDFYPDEEDPYQSEDNQPTTSYGRRN